MALTVHPLFKDQQLSAGDSATSAPIDLRYLLSKGTCGLHATISLGTAGTCGTTVLTYVGAIDNDALFISPTSASAIGTMGTACTADFLGVNSTLLPSIKIIATQVGTGTKGFDSKLTAELITQ